MFLNIYKLHKFSHYSLTNRIDIDLSRLTSKQIIKIQNELVLIDTSKVIQLITDQISSRSYSREYHYLNIFRSSYLIQCFFLLSSVSLIEKFVK